MLFLCLAWMRRTKAPGITHTSGIGGCAVIVLVSLLVLDSAYSARPQSEVARVTGLAPTEIRSPAHHVVSDTTDEPLADTTETDTTETDTLDTETLPPDSLAADTLGILPSVSDTTERDTTEADTTGAGGAQRTASQDDAPTAPRAPMALLPDAPVRVLADTVLYRRAHASLPEVIAEAPGSFVYHLGPEGWPHGWSRYGLPPHRTDYWLNDRRYVDPVTEQPRYDLLPALFTTRPSSEMPAARDGALGLSQQWRFFTADRPLTELRYRRGGGDLQAVEIVHTQGRPVSWLGRPARFAATFGYGGRSTADTYTSSEINLERQVLLRIRYQQDRWGLDLTNYSVRHRIETHGGVEPLTNGVRATVFAPELASVRTEGKRQTIRNDLALRLRWAWSERLPATQFSGGWTSNTFDVQGFFDKRTLRSHVVTTTLRQPLRWREHQAEAVGYVEHQPAPTDTMAAGTPALTRMQFGVRDSTRWLGIALRAAGHVHRHTDHGGYLSGRIEAERALGPLTVEGTLSSTARPSSRLETYGSGDLVTPLNEPVLTRTHRAHFNLQGRWRTLDGRIEVFGHRTEQAVDAERGADPLERTVRVVPDPVDVVGGSGRLRWRHAAERGLYAVVQGTALQVRQRADAPLLQQYAASVPEVYGRGRLGARFVLFQDLKIDLYAEAYGWSDFRSRWFHAPTGQLTLPALNAPATPGTPAALSPDGVVNVHAEADLRGAELMVSFENALAGTNVTPGTYVVPTYPLPGQRFRFSIHWPLFD